MTPFADPRRAAPLLASLCDAVAMLPSASPLGPDRSDTPVRSDRLSSPESCRATLTADLAACGDADGALLALHRLWETRPEAVAATLSRAAGRRALIALCASGSYLPSLLLRLPDGLDVLNAALDQQPFPWPTPEHIADAAPDSDTLLRRLRRLTAAAIIHLTTLDLGDLRSADSGGAESSSEATSGHADPGNNDRATPAPDLRSADLRSEDSGEGSAVGVTVRGDGPLDGAPNQAGDPLPHRPALSLSALFAATEGLCKLASVTLEAALIWCRRELVEKHGDVLREDGGICPFFVLGMGKLGAGELNYGSDVDLILLYGDGGLETTGKRPLSPQEFFTRLSRNLSRAIGESTADGKVFRVDLRLRPEGNSGAMAWSVGAAMAYYETVGDTWERAAYIKAATVAGDRAAGEHFLKNLQPFVYRRYLDFAALEAIREVKERIHARQVARDQVETDVKLGTGGIRDIEFFVQSQQLIHGGQDVSQRSPQTLTALAALVAAGKVSQADADILGEAYVFLRHVEHRVQLVADQQTHSLPTDPVHHRRLAIQMLPPSGVAGGDADDPAVPEGGNVPTSPWSGFLDRYKKMTRRVHRISHALFQAPEGAADDRYDTLLRQVAVDLEGVDTSTLGLRDRQGGLNRLSALHKAVSATWLPEASRLRWRKLLPLFFADIAAADNPDQGLAGLTRFAEALKGRGIYAAMLYENPHARALLAELFCGSRFLTGHLARHPALLDELLAPPQLIRDRPREELIAETEKIADLPDEEAWLDAMRRIKHREVLRMGLREIVADPGERTRGRVLADLAEILVTAVLKRSWRQLTARHGIPPGVDPDSGEETPGTGSVAVVAMGRLGGGEMGYASDLDLVFIHNGAMNSDTPGPKAMNVQAFYARLGQALVSKLTVGTGEGVLYEVDMRLRPSGASGQLVTSLSAFRHYQAQRAWTWEKQALTRSRLLCVAGGLGEAVNNALWQAVYTPRDAQETRAEVAGMRAKMRASLSHPKPDKRHLKHDPGGIVDIEFTIQYLLLAHGHNHPNVTHHNPRVALERLADAGLIDRDDADTLLNALSLYRTVEGHLNRLQGDADQTFDAEGVPIPGGRTALFEKVATSMGRVAEIYKKVVGWAEAPEA